jgi:hypothetical protein
VLHHPLWLLSPLVVLGVAFIVARPWSYMSEWRDYIEARLVGMTPVGSIDPREYLSTDFTIYLAVVIREDGGYQIIDYVDTIPGERLDSMRRSDGSVHLLNQMYDASVIGIPRGLLFRSMEDVWVRAHASPFIKPELKQDLETRLNAQIENREPMDPAVVAQFVMSHIENHVHNSEVIAPYRTELQAAISDRLGKLDTVDHRLLWPGALYEGASLLVLATWPYSVVAFPFVRRRRHRIKHNLCLKCAYSLDTNTTGICPECGRAIERANSHDNIDDVVEWPDS